jgi:hypothetical protein
MEIQLTVENMQSATGYAFDKLWQSFYPSVDDVYTNRGWAKPCWLIPDVWVSATNLLAYHVVAAPGFDLAHVVNTPGGLTGAQIVLRTLPRT